MHNTATLYTYIKHLDAQHTDIIHLHKTLTCITQRHYTLIYNTYMHNTYMQLNLESMLNIANGLVISRQRDDRYETSFNADVCSCYSTG